MTLWFNKRNDKIETVYENDITFMSIPGMIMIDSEIEIDYGTNVNFAIVLDHRGLRHEIHCKKFFDRNWDFDFFRR